MSVEQKVADRLAELRVLGDEVRRTRSSPSPGIITSDFVDVQIANRWLTSCLSLFGRVFGEESAHYKRLNEQFPSYPKWPNVEQAYGVLLAAIDDFEKEALFSIKQLIEAEVFDEFLDQAEQLHSSGYFQPAAVVAGSVLEDGLRKLCGQHNVTLPDRPKLDWMNSELAKAGAYNKLIQKKVTALADIRNNAAHGNWGEFTSEDVTAMIRDIRDFMCRHFA